MPDKGNPTSLKFKSIEELKPHYDGLELSGINPRDLMQKLEMIFKNAKEKMKTGDIENAYITIMKYLNVFSFIQQSDDYKKHTKYYKMMLGKKPVEAMELAEELHSLLVTSYNILKKSNNTDNIKVEEEPAIDIPDMRVKRESKSIVTSAKLFSMLRDGVTKVLIMDTRPAPDFENSRIKENVINVPHDIIVNGKSAYMLEQELPEDSKRLWRKRGDSDHVVLLDWMTNEDNVQASKLSILKDILTQWDINTVYKNEILILDGGYEDWLNSYPWNTTNPKPPRPQLEEVTSDIILDQIVYPELDDLNAPADQELLKPFFDRSKKPMSNELDDSFRNYSDKDFDSGAVPSFDRAKKAAAIRTYEERKADMENLLSQKEIETSEAIILERSMIDKERELQETIEKQRDMSADEETRKQLEEEEEKLLIKVEELREESIVKDKKIKELEKIIEIYEKKDAEEIVRKEEDRERQIKEMEMNLRIKIQEEERKKLEKEREEMEKSREEERLLLKEKYRKKLERAKKSKEFQSDFTVSPAHFPVNYNVVPTINRANKPRFEEKIRQFSGVKGNVGRGLTGLKNLGNTCYMNSIIQCISNNSALAKYFCGNHYLHDVNMYSKTKGEVAGELSAVIKTLWSGRFRSIACRDLKQVVGLHKPEYSSYEQQDSHEFLTFLMDWLHGDLNKVSDAAAYASEKRMNEAEKAWWGFKKKNESLVWTLFYGLQKSTVTCLECNEESSTYEPFSNLSLIIPESEHCTIEQCLKLYMKSERISGWRCPKCKEFREAEKKTDIYKLPPILVIHLKRFHYIEVLSRKRTTFVDFPLTDLNMAQYALSHKDRHVNYNLYAVSNHYGTMEGGHYTAYCKSALYNKWYKFDDHEVFEISPNEVKTSAAYILFYTSISYEVPDVTS